MSCLGYLYHRNRLPGVTKSLNVEWSRIVLICFKIVTRPYWKVTTKFSSNLNLVTLRPLASGTNQLIFRKQPFSGNLNGTVPKIVTESDQGNVLQIMEKFSMDDTWIQINKGTLYRPHMSDTQIPNSRIPFLHFCS